jgi:hypothetical protein
MANLVAPKGFVPVRYLNGAAWNGAVNLYRIPSTDGLIYSPGDVVRSVSGADANGIPNIVKAAAGDTARGVIAGILTAIPNNPTLVGTNLDLTVQNTPATKTRDYYALVVDDPMVVFELQDDGVAVLTATAANFNANWVVANPTSPRQNSATTLNSNTVAVTSTFSLKMLGLAQRSDNAFGQYAVWNVIFNLHEFKGGAGSAGY